MLQRKNKSKNTTQSGYNSGSGYESNNGYESTDSSPSKQLLKPLSSSSANVGGGGGKLKKSSSGISIASLTGGNDNKLHSSSTCGNTNCSTSHNNNNNKQPKISIAKVKRNKFGTSPFDERWLNLDCCGLICASLTYMLHLYGMYSFGWILLPPWFSVMDEDGYRELTFGCHFHRTFFILIASLAIYSHFKAMTTDPGAVPPDANPLPEPFPITKAATDNVDEEEQKKLDDLDNLIKGEPSPTKTTTQNHSTSSSLMQEDNGIVSQAVVTAGAAVVGAAAIGAVGVAAAASAMGPIKANNSTPQQPQRGKRMCRRCQAFKPPRAHHCSICKRCIIKMDHHCPWVNNCVGIGNHKYFLLFIFYTSLSCAYSFLFIVYRFFNCIGSTKHHGPRCVDHPTDLLPLVGLTVEALLFGLFTICMMVDQWDVVMTNLTHIDRLKGHGAMGGHSALISNVRAGINEVFGTGRHSMTSSTSSTATYTRFHYTWLSPLHKTCFPDTVRDDIFGYCRPCTTTRSGRGGSVEIV